VASDGKQFMSARLAAGLRAAREALTGADSWWNDKPQVSAFLDVALDKQDECYGYPSYLALSLLAGVAAVPARGDPAPEQTRWRVGHLIADAMFFELSARLGRHTVLPVLRPDDAVLRKRLRHGLRLASFAVPAVSAVSVDDPKTLTQHYETLNSYRCELPEHQRLLLDITVLPTYVAHDEYLFIRVLQSFESVFQYLAAGATAACRQLQAGQVTAAGRLLRSAGETLAATTPLFSLAATVQPPAFAAFRDHTDGASAIQSVSYKTFEIVCGQPTPERLASKAFDSVPMVRARAAAGAEPTIDSLAAELDPKDQQTQELRASMAFLEEVHQQWKRSHYGIAVRLLGDSRGTGYTEGTPYVRATLSNVLFSPPD
jgi:tryptophan 2,3-dioxygenase